MKTGVTKQGRHEAIRRVVEARLVSTQDELAQLLAAEGIEVTQATLSRDLAQLGAARVHRPDGPAFYELQPLPAAAPSDTSRLRHLGGMVTSLLENDALVVIRTFPGSAPAVALGIDQARLPESLGTLAGDDTIFVTPVRGTSTRKLARLLRGMLAMGEPT
jgi:transcriptional regulator of arginine metabolism